MAVLFIVIGALLIFSLILLALSRSMGEAPVYRDVTMSVVKKIAQQKVSFMEEFAVIMRQEFPDCAAKVSVVSLDGFYEFSNNWIYSHRAKGESSRAARAKSIEDIGFRNELRKRLSDLLPEQLASIATADFDRWTERMDKIIKVSMERALANEELAKTAA